MMALFDHLAICAQHLDEGALAVETRLGVPLEPGGKHPVMGTHNRLLSLGPGEYLEVIAIDPDADAPRRRRWFGLDEFRGAPRPGAWIARAENLRAAMQVAPPGIGRPLELERGDYAWAITVPDDGRQPFDGVFPALIGWQTDAHPADHLPDRGVRLVSLELLHPDPIRLTPALMRLLHDPRIRVRPGVAPGLRALFDTPAGRRMLP